MSWTHFAPIIRQPFASVTSLIYIWRHERVYWSEIFYFQYHFIALLLRNNGWREALLSCQLPPRSEPHHLVTRPDHIEILSDMNSNSVAWAVIYYTEPHLIRLFTHYSWRFSIWWMMHLEGSFISAQVSYLYLKYIHTFLHTLHTHFFQPNFTYNFLHYTRIEMISFYCISYVIE